MSFFKGNYYTPKDASKKLGVHWQTLRNWEKQGKIKTIRSPGGKRYYDINNFMTDIENNSDIKEDHNNSDVKENENIRRKICY